MSKNKKLISNIIIIIFIINIFMACSLILKESYVLNVTSQNEEEVKKILKSEIENTYNIDRLELGQGFNSGELTIYYKNGETKEIIITEGMFKDSDIGYIKANGYSLDDIARNIFIISFLFLILWLILRKITVNDENSVKMIAKENTTKFIAIIVLACLILAVTIYTFYIESPKQNILSVKEYSDNEEFYLENENMYVKNNSNEYVQVPGDFSEMSIIDYTEGTYQAKTNIGEMYFYYKKDGKIYLVLSDNSNCENWEVKELTSESIGVPENSKIKYIRISGNHGFIFYIAPDGIGGILKSTTEGNYWEKLKTDFELNDNCEFKFLNEFGMDVDGFLTVPSDDNSKCDIYEVDSLEEETLKKIDISNIYKGDKKLDYYHMPEYWEENKLYCIMEVGESSTDTNTEKFVAMDKNWQTISDYYQEKEQEAKREEEYIKKYNEIVDNLDSDIFLIDAENYDVESNEIKISEEKAKKIAENGFDIADTDNDYDNKETIEIKEVSANRFFTAKYNESRDAYPDIKRKAYVVSKSDDIGNGVSVYVDVTTGLIIGGRMFGD